MEYHSYESVFEKEDKLYIRVSYSNGKIDAETKRRLGWTFIADRLTFSEAIKVCEEHNKSILEERMRR
mgnify:CR=1 FL=1